MAISVKPGDIFRRIDLPNSIIVGVVESVSPDSGHVQGNALQFDRAGKLLLAHTPYHFNINSETTVHEYFEESSHVEV